MPHVALGVIEAQFSGRDGYAIEFGFVEPVAPAGGLGVVGAGAVAIGWLGGVGGSWGNGESAGLQLGEGKRDGVGYCEGNGAGEEGGGGEEQKRMHDGFLGVCEWMLFNGRVKLDGRIAEVRNATRSLKRLEETNMQARQ